MKPLNSDVAVQFKEHRNQVKALEQAIHQRLDYIFNCYFGAPLGMKWHHNYSNIYVNGDWICGCSFNGNLPMKCKFGVHVLDLRNMIPARWLYENFEEELKAHTMYVPLERIPRYIRES